MHELGIAQEVVAIAWDKAQGARVRRVVLEVGQLSAVLPDSLRFCFDLCCQSTPLEGAELIILETPGKARCRGCGTELSLDRPFAICACGSSDLEWLSGDELKIKQLELE